MLAEASSLGDAAIHRMAGRPIGRVHEPAIPLDANIGFAIIHEPGYLARYHPILVRTGPAHQGSAAGSRRCRLAPAAPFDIACQQRQWLACSAAAGSVTPDPMEAEPRPPVCIDLDGTLVRSDTLVEGRSTMPPSSSP